MLPFLQYYEGAKPGKGPKRPSTDGDESGKAKRQEYEKNRRPDRCFNEKWRDGRPWLIYSDNVMKCQICVDFYQKEANTRPTLKGIKGGDRFIEGSSNFRKSAISDHEQSKCHVQASMVTRSRNMDVSDLPSTTAGKTLKCIKFAERQRLSHLFRNAFYVAKYNRPLTDYISLCKLDKTKNVDIGDTYQNEKAALEFISCIAENQRSKVRKLLNDSSYFSFIMDGTTDIAGDEQETIYVRSSFKGIIYEKFLTIGSPSSTSAADLYDYTIATFKDYDIHEFVEAGKLIGMGSDGASNMLGKNHGLGKLMQKDNPEMLLIHCLNHRLELGFRDAFKKNKNYEKLTTLLIGLHYFYIKSSKQKKGLLAAIKALEIDVILPPKITGTRWLPHLARGIRSFLRNFRAYEVHLCTISHNNAKAEGMVKMLLNKQIMAFVLLLQDLLDPLERLSLLLQQKGITLSHVHTWVETTCEMLEECKHRNTQALNDLLETGLYSGVELKGKTPELAYKDDLISNLIKAITDRFCLDKTNEGVIEATRITNFALWPPNIEELKDFGDENLRDVLKHFTTTLQKSGVDMDACVPEWKTLKKLVFKSHSDDFKTLTWAKVHQEFGELTNVLHVLDLLHSFPPTSVSCETTFSHMKLVKTARRSKLKNSTLNNLLTVKLEAPSLECFSPDEAIDTWLVTPVRKRRLNYKRKQRSVVSTQEEVSNEVIVESQEVPENNVESQEEMCDSESETEDDMLAFNKTMIDDDSDYFSDFEDYEQNSKKLIDIAQGVN